MPTSFITLELINNKKNHSLIQERKEKKANYTSSSIIRPVGLEVVEVDERGEAFDVVDSANGFVNGTIDGGESHFVNIFETSSGRGELGLGLLAVSAPYRIQFNSNQHSFVFIFGRLYLNG